MCNQYIALHKSTEEIGEISCMVKYFGGNVNVPHEQM